MLPAGNREKKLQNILNVFTFAFFFVFFKEKMSKTRQNKERYAQIAFTLSSVNKRRTIV